MRQPDYRHAANYLNSSDAFLNHERNDFSTLLNEGISLFNVNIETVASELGCIPATIKNWCENVDIPLDGMQQAAIEKIRSRAPKYERHYDIIWAKTIDAKNPAAVSYWHDHWLISYATRGCWSLCGHPCWTFIDVNKGTILESTVVSLLFACAREKILDEASDVLAEFQFEVSNGKD